MEAASAFAQLQLRFMDQVQWPNRATTSFTLVGTFADFTLSVLIRRG